MSTFTYISKYGIYHDCYFRKGYYENKNLAIEIWNTTEGPIIRVTVNPYVKLPDDRIAIKNYSENEGMVDWLVSHDIIEEDAMQIIVSGLVELPVHALTENGKKYLGLV